ncbi:MAG TPA: SH3 domain-containing C40 family peptidase [Gemmatimonadaceae bacterium]|nr:SH3 domain-containing C40 family peptidase [Gemmatimonadaceae bacterium]
MSPDRSLGMRAGRHLAAGGGDVLVVRAPIAPLVAEPRVSASQVTQALAGHPLSVLTREGSWVRVAGADGYEGWVHTGYLADPAAALGPAAGRWYDAAPTSLGCVVEGPFGARRLPLGALLLPGERVVRGDTVAPEELERRFPRRAPAAVETALRCFAGTSYQWGGVTPWGADCSGLVQSVFALHGLALPRDAWQQALEGEALAGAAPFTDADALRAADLLFFSERADGRITHVGIATGDGRMVHLSLGRGGYAVERLAATDDAYVTMLAGNFRVARRLPW